MSPHPRLEKLEVGCVQYLNARPLIHGYEGKVFFGHPSRLSALLSQGLLDVALAPVYELLQRPDYYVADGVSISSFGPVFSVFLAYHGKLNKIKTISLDTASLTSAHLLRCLLAEFYGLAPDYVPADRCADENATRLLIGNQAIDFRRAHGDEYQYLDLGGEWTLRTSLPFVFAAWLLRHDIENAAGVADELRKLKQHGIASIAEIVLHENKYDAAFGAHYLRSHIRYELGDAEKAGLARFRELLVKHGFIPASGLPPVFV